MPRLRESGPYIWITWLARLLAGEQSCEWASQFKAHNDAGSWERAPSTFDLAGWQIRHTNLLRRCAEEHRQHGYLIALEGQNAFRLRGQTATLAGKPDLVVLLDKERRNAKVIDAKAGNPKTSDQVQVMLYMYLIPLALPGYQDFTLAGQVVYENHSVDIPPGAVDKRFISSVQALVRRLGAREPAVRAPSWGECRFCDITAADCPERVEGFAEEMATTDHF